MEFEKLMKYGGLKLYPVEECTSKAWPVVHSTTWQGIPLSDFRYCWEEERTPRLVFSAQHDREWLYCLFEVADRDILVYVDKNAKEEVIRGDRVEIFLRQDDRMENYYCLEIDFYGRVYDYRASYHRKFDPQWSWPSGHLKVDAIKTEEGYRVALALSKESLSELGLLKNEQLQAGIFRGKCLSFHPQNEKMKWISWVKPDSPTPDFHIPSAFGILALAKKRLG